jgi:hypothetical protein
MTETAETTTKTFTTATATATATTTATTTRTTTMNLPQNEKIALVIGANNEQGRAVIEGLVDSQQYTIVYAMINKSEMHNSSNSNHHHHHHHHQSDSMQYQNSNIEQYITDGLGATIINGDIQNINDIHNVLITTNANYIFMITTTQLPTSIPVSSTSTSSISTTTSIGYQKAADEEYETIINFFHTFVDLYKNDDTSHHVILSVRDNVQTLVEQEYERTKEIWIEPLCDGSIVPHFTAKGRGGHYAVQYIQNNTTGSRSNITITLLTIPFLYSNFLSYFTPLPDDTRTQWLLTACFGDGHMNQIDMMSASDLSIIVRT